MKNGFFLRLLAVYHRRQEHPHLIGQRCVKHTALKPQRLYFVPDTIDSGSARNIGIPLHCGKVNADMRACAVAAKIYLRRIPAVALRDLAYPVYAVGKRVEYPENIGVGHERIFRAENNEPAAAHISRKKPVGFFSSEQKTAAVDINEHR